MSGLFADLAARFDPAGAPAIRPRLPGRFEGSADGPPLQEEVETNVVAGDEPRPVFRPAGTRQVPHSDGPAATDARTVAPGSPDAATGDAAPVQPSPDEPATQPQRDTADAVYPATPAAQRETRVETRTERVIERTVERVEPKVAGPSSAAPEPPADERKHTASAPAAPHIETRVVRPEADERPERSGLDRPPVSAEAPVIRIGRIEVAAPTSPPPPAPAKPRPAPAPAQRMEPRSAAPTGSRLTERLGWKR